MGMYAELVLQAVIAHDLLPAGALMASCHTLCVPVDHGVGLLPLVQ
jgi:hypothetical protein